MSTLDDLCNELHLDKDETIALSEYFAYLRVRKVMAHFQTHKIPKDEIKIKEIAEWALRVSNALRVAMDFGQTPWVIDQMVRYLTDVDQYHAFVEKYNRKAEASLLKKWNTGVSP